MKKIILTLTISSLLTIACKHKGTERPSSAKQQNTTEHVRNLNPEGNPYSTDELEALSHDELMALSYETPKDTILSIGILLYDGYFSLDALGPHAVLSSMYPAKTFFIAKEKGLVTSNNGIKMPVDTTIAQVKHLDILLVPGGLNETYLASKDDELLKWIKMIDKSSKYTASVCSGAWLLGEAGLLKGKKATTNWYKAEEKLTSYGAHFVNERYTNDGKYWTSAGVSAGIDMSLALADHIMGRNYAQFIMLNLEYDPQPPFEGGTFEKTDPLVAFMTEKMYDLSLETVVKKQN